jgi:transcriptional regulator with XRE-family HTH domain
MELIRPSNEHRLIDAAELYIRRTAAGLTQQQTADRVGALSGRASLSRQFISKIEKPGKHEIPSDIALALLKIFRPF